MIISVCSLSGAPGVTTVATALTAVWPTGPVKLPVLVEADVSGGDVGAWYRVLGRPGIVRAVAATRRDLAVLPGNDEVRPALRFATELPGGLRVLLAPPTPHEAGAVVSALAQRMHVLHGGVSVVDLGRVMPGTAGAAILAASDAVVLAVNGQDASQIYRVSRCRDVLEALTERGVRVGLAVRNSRFSTPEIESETGYPVWAQLPEDPVGAAFLRGSPIPPRGLVQRLSAWSHARRDPDDFDWMPLISASRRLADRADDVILTSGSPQAQPERTAA